MTDTSLCRVVVIWWLRSDNHGCDISVAHMYAADVYFNGRPELRDKFIDTTAISAACIL